mmetsp:Transcript_16976/g.23742  ORF Transcript_16976/g.23742 Transcript_16976/m.23742 type:complete len:710 (-) Transcript_16976:316-2445(-)|eukprot:CAMPEP_0184481698 /NCGR_PEP_ID=MMETSP0113_2-20130426/3267_1 /TAXON_ID=91329 /ORGANISM="Norrisiella sphaerica, Strain BC52" /LENGTH=709 /DNA_ID=CAMNT_0026860995 /DNA_START=157 /DNA_END=2286 /DNA_ORIENTATION=-
MNSYAFSFGESRHFPSFGMTRVSLGYGTFFENNATESDPFVSNKSRIFRGIAQSLAISMILLAGFRLVSPHPRDLQEADVRDWEVITELGNDWSQQPLVMTENVEFQGTGCDNRPWIHAFRGIPYAEPPVEHLRFRAPKPYAWGEFGRDKSDNFGVKPRFHALEFCASCFQFYMHHSNLNSSEDCLCLNVYSRAGSEKDHLSPVMVFFHGGFFLMGDSSQYDGCDFLNSTGFDLILVTANYRLGPLGFLYDRFDNDGIGDHQKELDGERGVSISKARGNFGFLDQVLVLKWVRENARYFGGDSSRVTIWGQSAGAHSVLLHTVAETSKGLFQRAIAMSPRADRFLSRSAARRTASILKSSLGCTESQSLRDCMTKENLSVSRLADVIQDPRRNLLVSGMRGSKASILGRINFMPVVNTSVFPAQPLDMMRQGLIHENIEGIILGTNTYEGNLFQSQDANAWWEDQVSMGNTRRMPSRRDILQDWRFDKVADRLWGKGLSKKVARVYERSLYANVSHSEYQVRSQGKVYTIRDFQRIGQAYGEFMYTCACRRAASAMWEHSSSSSFPSTPKRQNLLIFKYLFAHMPKDFANHPNQACWNATHATNVPFAFSSSGAAFRLSKFGPRESQLAASFSQSIIRFASSPPGSLSADMRDLGWSEWQGMTQRNMMWITKNATGDGLGSRMIASAFAWPGNPLLEKNTCEALWDHIA